jgi:hypothetical protein
MSSYKNYVFPSFPKIGYAMPPNQLNFTIFITELLPYSLVEHTNIHDDYI